MSRIFSSQSPPEDTNVDPILIEYLFRMFRDLVSDLDNIYDGRTIDVRHNPPLKPRDGMMAYADGTNWNPGAGEGFYGRENGVWVKL